MSLRNLKKLRERKEPPVPEDTIDEDYEPLYVKETPTSAYAGLEVSDHSDNDEIDDCSDNSTHKDSQVVKDKENPKKKNVKRKNKKKQNKMLEEVDKIMKEMNDTQFLTEDFEAGSSIHTEQLDPRVEIFGVQTRHLNLFYEQNRVFGPETQEEETKKRSRQSKLTNLLRRNLIVPYSAMYERFKKVGLSMSVIEKINGISYFCYDHNKDYQRIQKTFTQTRIVEKKALLLETAEANLHVEGILECADSSFILENFTKAKELVELAVAYLHYCAHPSFLLSSDKIRLQYKFVENRTFFVSVLKYIHLLTNKACHRTALELAKLLLNLDPSDPLAILMVIDVIAVRAREHQWLIDAVGYWRRERSADLLFNIQYSFALCHFHIALKKKENQEQANNYLKHAILQFPTTVVKILECASYKISNNIKDSPLFAEESTPNNLQDLIALYAKMTWSRWHEKPVISWLVKNAEEMADQFRNDLHTKDKVRRLTNERLNLFQAWPAEVIRHLCVIKPMASLLVDGAVPDVQLVFSSNPMPHPNGVDRYGYQLPNRRVRPRSPVGSPMYNFFASMIPEVIITAPPEDEED